MTIKTTLLRRRRRSFVSASFALGALIGLSQSARTQDAAKVEAGEAVYNDYCFTCHGEQLVSSGQTYDLRRLTAADRARFDTAVLIGNNQMPPWTGSLT